MARAKSVERSGDDPEVQKLVNDNMPLAKFFAKKYFYCYPSILDEADCLSIAMRGLFDAARKFDPKRGIPFGSYTGQIINWYFSHQFKRICHEKRGWGSISIPLDTNFVHDSNAPMLHDIIADPNSDSWRDRLDTEKLALCEKAIDTLKDSRWRKIIRARFGLDGGRGVALEVLGKRFGITRERVRQIEFKALRVMRAAIEKHEKRGYLDTIVKT